MKLKTIRISNFQSFGEKAIKFSLDDITYLIGPNGSGKTAALKALCRLFAFNPSMRRVKRSDFHIPFDEETEPDERHLWIEADFSFPELSADSDNSTVPPHFGHMRLEEASGIPRVRYRLSATMGMDGDIEEKLEYVLNVDQDDSPTTTSLVTRSERNKIQVHYLPARRDPADHITYSTNALLGRMFRAVNWDKEHGEIKVLTDKISSTLAANSSVNAFSDNLKTIWKKLHKGSFFTDPKISFVASDVEALLRHMSISFSPGHDESVVDFSRLSDGQKSMLYLTLVLSSQAIGRAALTEEDCSFDLDRLRPPAFTVVAVEEPENSLSPHYLGRIVSALGDMAQNEDAQAIIATHAPSMLRRVAPEHIRYLRLTKKRQSRVKHIKLPPKKDDAHKFVREAVQAFPEIYFSRLVVLGEGDSEEIVLPRLFRAKGIPVDESAVTIAPLGGRHVNHFWRLLAALKIPYLTLLDLDVARYQAGWGRIKYVNDQLGKFEPSIILPTDWPIPKWNDDNVPIISHHFFKDATKDVFIELENREVFFSFPLDLDFALLIAYPAAYGVEKETPDESTIKAVLGKSYHDSSQYNKNELELFSTYHRRFKTGSKPAAHISALAQLSDADLLNNIPDSLGRLADAVIGKLKELPE